MTITREAATSVLEDRVTKISKAMSQLVKDAPRIADVLDDDAMKRTEAFILRRLGDMMRELAAARASRPASVSFSLDAPVDPTPYVPAAPPPYAGPKPAYAMAMQDRQPVPHADEPDLSDDDLSVLEVLDVATGGEGRPDPKPEAPKRWRRPIGRLAGTGEPIYGDPDEFKVPRPEAGEQPDRTGQIADAGFIDAD
jgi:hypothetical protein